MKLIDMNCDTLWKLLDLDKEGDLSKNHCSVSIPYMKAAGTTVQFFACFTWFGEYENAGGYDSAYEHVRTMIAYMKRQTEHFSEELSLADSWSKIEDHMNQGRISAVLTVEEGGVLNGRMERLEELYREGIRLITPVWNYENCIGFPNSQDASIMEEGLKPFGREVVEYMGRLGMIVDVSHASDGTFWDILECAGGPVVASHSNCRALTTHPRNLTDDMIRALAGRGGVAGVNFYGPFLGNPKVSSVDQMVRHILHMLKVGGSEFPAIGTDFDGFDGMEIMEIPDVSQMERLWDALKRSGVAESQIDKIWYGNAARILQSV